MRRSIGRAELRQVAHVEVCGQYGVAGEEDARLPVEEGHRGRLVARTADHVDHAASEVEGDRLIRPGAEAEEADHLGRTGADDRRARTAAQQRIAGDVVAVRVRVRHHERVRADEYDRVAAQPVGGQPLDGRAQRELRLVRGRARVDEEGALPPEQQVQERRLPVRALGCRSCTVSASSQVISAAVMPGLRGRLRGCDGRDGAEGAERSEGRSSVTFCRGLASTG